MAQWLEKQRCDWEDQYGPLHHIFPTLTESQLYHFFFFLNSSHSHICWNLIQFSFSLAQSLPLVAILLKILVKILTVHCPVRTQNMLTVSLADGVRSPSKCSDVLALNCIWRWGSSSRDLGSVKHPVLNPLAGDTVGICKRPVDRADLWLESSFSWLQLRKKKQPTAFRFFLVFHTLKLWILAGKLMKNVWQLFGGDKKKKLPTNLFP